MQDRHRRGWWWLTTVALVVAVAVAADPVVTATASSVVSAEERISAGEATTSSSIELDQAVPAASEKKEVVVDSASGEADDAEPAEYREFQQFRFPDDPRYDPRLHQLSPQQQSQILEDIRQHHRFHQQHQQQQQLHQQHLRVRERERPHRNRQPLQPIRQDTHFSFNQNRPQDLNRPSRPDLLYSQEQQPQFNAISPLNNHRQPPIRYQSENVYTNAEATSPFKITLSEKPIPNFQAPVASVVANPAVQPVLFVQPTINVAPQLEDAQILAFPQHAQFPTVVSNSSPVRQAAPPTLAVPSQPPGPTKQEGTQFIYSQPSQPAHHQPPATTRTPLTPVQKDTAFESAFHKNTPYETNQHQFPSSSGDYTPKENTISVSSQAYFPQFNKQSKIPTQEPLGGVLQSGNNYFEPAPTPFPPSRTQPPRSEVIHDLPEPITRRPLVTESTNVQQSVPLKISSTSKPPLFGDRKYPKHSPSVSPIPTIPKIKFPKELEEEYSLVSVKHLNEAVSEAELAKSSESPRPPKHQQENHLPHYGLEDAETTTRDYHSAVYLQEDRKQLYEEITKAQQAEQATKPPRPRKTTKPPKEIIEITYQQKASTSRPPATKSTKKKPDDIIHPPDLQEQLLKQLQEQFSQRQDLMQQLKLDSTSAGALPASILTSTDFLPKNATGPIITSGGQKYQVIQLPAKEAAALLAKQKAASAGSIPIPKSTSASTTAKPPKKVLDELTRGVIPQGADFELIRKTEDGRLETVKGVPSSLPDKKVTFVLLEEQQDGSYKVQGVRGNNDNKEASGDEVDTILKKIKAGEIELPPPSRDDSAPKRTSQPPSRSSSVDSVASPSSPTYSPPTTSTTPTTNYPESSPKTQNVKLYVNGGSGDLHTSSPNSIYKTTDEFTYTSTAKPSYSLSTSPTPSTVYNNYSPSSVSHDDTSPLNNFATTSQTYPTYSQDYSPVTPSSSRPSSYLPESTSSGENNWQVSASSSAFPTSETGVHAPAVSSSSPSTAPQNYYSQTQFLPTVSSITDNSLPSSTAGPVPYSVEPHLSLSQQNYFAPQPEIQDTQYADPTSAYSSHGDKTGEEHHEKNHRSMYSHSAPVNHKYTNLTAEPIRVRDTLIDTLKKHGLYAMARFLRQSGLDSILNDTGPYTVFVPTDRAFKTLLVQLGGPDRAEEKFRENPRLLSGLLLHHVIPGAFRLTSLQDEMTGVSLAGTQLRVNTYTTQDIEWNDVQVVTINGAQVLQELHDISIPQGIAHAVDRVMFPLPVGDLVQTLSADKDRRFATFLRAVRTSGLSDMLTGTKTYTVFAPTERAFQGLKDSDLARLTSERASARALVLKHIMPTTFYSAGMRYFQVRESMARGKQITIVNEEGRIKANAALIVTHNIPATNGVVHAIDTLL